MDWFSVTSVLLTDSPVLDPFVVIKITISIVKKIYYFDYKKRQTLYTYSIM